MTPKEKREHAIANLHKMCENCGFYNDCPAYYICPPMKLILEVLDEMEAKEENKE